MPRVQTIKIWRAQENFPTNVWRLQKNGLLWQTVSGKNPVRDVPVAEDVKEQRMNKVWGRNLSAGNRNRELNCEGGYRRADSVKKGFLLLFGN